MYEHPKCIKKCRRYVTILEYNGRRVLYYFAFLVRVSQADRTIAVRIEQDSADFKHKYEEKSSVVKHKMTINGIR